MMRALVLYATRRNSTAEVAEIIGQQLETQGIEITVANVETFDGTFEDYDAFVFGTSIYNGMWLMPLVETVRRAVPQIQDKPTWAWSMYIRVLEDGGEAHAKVNYLPERLLGKLNLQGHQFFAGKLFIQDIDFEDRWTLSVRYDGTELPTGYNDDYRDWDAIKAWAKSVGEQMVALSAV